LRIISDKGLVPSLKVWLLIENGNIGTSDLDRGGSIVPDAAIGKVRVNSNDRLVDSSVLVVLVEGCSRRWSGRKGNEVNVIAVGWNNNPFAIKIVAIVIGHHLVEVCL